MSQQITSLEILDIKLREFIFNHFSGRNLTRESFEVIAKTTRIVNALVTPIEPDGYVDPVFEFAEGYFCIDDINELKSRLLNEFIEENGAVKVEINGENVFYLVDNGGLIEVDLK